MSRLCSAEVVGVCAHTHSWLWVSEGKAESPSVALHPFSVSHRMWMDWNG